MHTQSTPVHVKLWHRDFWMMSLANMLLSAAVYMLVPAVPQLCRQETEAGGYGIAALAAAYCAGLFAPGMFASYLVQRYRRNVVCMLAVLFMALCFMAMYYLHDGPAAFGHELSSGFMAVLCFSLGASFTLAHISLASTLIIDKCESFLRTEANYAAAWFYRFSLSLGPAAAIIIGNSIGFQAVLPASALCCAAALLLVGMVHFPFKAPEETMHAVSLDRFFLPRGFRLFVNQAMIMAAVGLVLSAGHTMFFYATVMAGFFGALLAQKFVFINAELKSEIITGLFFLACSVLLLLCRRGGVVEHAAPVFIGFGTGLTGARFLLFFLKLGNHCQRGTSQTTFFLSWESGLSMGLALGFMPLCSGDCRLYAALALVVLALIMYHASTHSWYMSHKNR